MKKLTIFSCILIFSIAFSLASKNYAFANTVSLDQSFDEDGKSTITFVNNSTSKGLLLSSGKIIISGSVSNGSNYDWSFIKLNNDGSLSTSFGTSGKKIIDFGGNEYVTRATIQKDEKILSSTVAVSSIYQWKVVRLTADGSLDSTFGVGGVTTSFDGTFSYISTPLVQKDEKIVGIGWKNGDLDDIAIVRYNPDGSLDTSFGNSGIVTMPIGNSNDRANTGIIQPDGKIIVYGEYYSGFFDQIFLIRLNPDGSLDTSFGNNGKVTQRIGSSGHDRANEIALQSDGKIIIVGGTNWVFDSLAADTFLARFNSDGSLDSSFGSNGKTIQSFSGVDSGNSLSIRPDGKIIVGGYEMDGNLNFALRRFNSDGTLDSNFGTNGSFTEATGFTTGEINSMAIQDDGKILLSGYGSSGGDNSWVVARFTESVPLTIDLNVPLFKQTDPAWKNHIYDSANIWNPQDPRINSFGCALTSAAMVLKYHGYNKLPGNIVLDPRSLNKWLKSQKDGYLGLGFVNWTAFSRLSKESKNLNGVNFTGLEFVRTTGNASNTLREALKNNLPGILKVPGHFVVARGITNEVFSIHDPYFSRTSLSDYGNTFENVGVFTPSYTDLSYMMIATDPGTEIELLDSNGNSVGETIIENPIVNPESPDQNNGNMKILYLAKPNDTNYNLVISSSGNYEAKIYLYDKDGQAFIRTETGILPPEQSKTIPINFNGQENIYKKKTTYLLTTLEIEKLFLKRQITNRSVKRELEESLARAALQKILKNDEKQLKYLTEFEGILNENKGIKILPGAYETLLYDANYLSSHL